MAGEVSRGPTALRPARFAAPRRHRARPGGRAPLV